MTPVWLRPCFLSLKSVEVLWREKWLRDDKRVQIRGLHRKSRNILTLIGIISSPSARCLPPPLPSAPSLIHSCHLGDWEGGGVIKCKIGREESIIKCCKQLFILFVGLKIPTAKGFNKNHAISSKIMHEHRAHRVNCGIYKNLGFWKKSLSWKFEGKRDAVYVYYLYVYVCIHHCMLFL